MASVDDLEELIATRRLNGLNDNLYKESDKPVANDKDYTLAYLKGYADAEEKYREKVKDVLQNNRNEIFSTTYLDNEQFKPYTMQIDRINKIEKELLEENK